MYLYTWLLPTKKSCISVDMSIPTLYTLIHVEISIQNALVNSLTKIFRLFVDEIPIRVFKNYTSIGARYPSQAMVVEGSIWNGEAWASGGKKVNWSQAPFQANYKGFEIFGCPFGNQCDSNKFLWNMGDTWQLNIKQQESYERVKRKYVYYSYCSTKSGRRLYKECQFEWEKILIQIIM